MRRLVKAESPERREKNFWSTQTQITAHNDSLLHTILVKFRNVHKVINQCCNYVHFDGLLPCLVICYACQNFNTLHRKKPQALKRTRASSSCLNVDKSFDQ